jgi:hypothetical protein
MISVPIAAATQIATNTARPAIPVRPRIVVRPATTSALVVVPFWVMPNQRSTVEAAATAFATLHNATRHEEAGANPGPGLLVGRPDQAKLTVFAPATTCSTTMAAPTIWAPFASPSSVMPRGFVQTPQSHTSPPWPTNSS